MTNSMGNVSLELPAPCNDKIITTRIIQPSLKFQPYKHYNIRFHLQSSITGTVDIEVADAENPGIKYLARQKIAVSEALQDYSYEFYIDFPIEARATLQFIIKQQPSQSIDTETFTINDVIIQPEVNPLLPERESGELLLDASAIQINNYRGVGIQWDPFTDYPLDETQWEKLAKRLDHLKPAFLRTMIYANFYCIGFEDDGTPVYDLDNTEFMRPLYQLLDYAQSRGIPIVFGEWEPPVKFTGTAIGKVDVDNPKWAKMIVGLLHHLLITKRYSVIRYYNLVNEANQPWSLVADFEKWKKGIGFLKQELQACGLDNQIQIIGPDTVWDPDWIQLTVDQLHDSLGAYDIHIYADYHTVVSGQMEMVFAAKKDYAAANDPMGRGKDFYLTEAGMLTGKTDGDSQPNVKEFWYGVSMVDLAVQSMRSGLSGIALWDLDDAMHGQDNGYGKMDPRSLKRWGLWNSWGGKMGVPEEENLRPVYYVWSLLTRLFPAGSQIFHSAGLELHGLRSAGMRMYSDNGYAMSYAIVNNSITPRTILLRVDGIAHQAVTMREYRYFEQEQKTDSEGYPVPSGIHDTAFLDKGLEIDLPGRGVVFLTTILLK
jgi:hypothetical protein